MHRGAMSKTIHGETADFRRRRTAMRGAATMAHTREEGETGAAIRP